MAKRDDRDHYLALGGDIGFLLERLRTWVVDVTTTSGQEVVVVVEDATAWDPDLGETVLAGFIYEPDHAATDPADEYRQTGKRPDGATGWALPWSFIDTVEVN